MEAVPLSASRLSSPVKGGPMSSAELGWDEPRAIWLASMVQKMLLEGDGDCAVLRGCFLRRQANIQRFLGDLQPPAAAAKANGEEGGGGTVTMKRTVLYSHG